jgi:hypothetical protein
VHAFAFQFTRRLLSLIGRVHFDFPSAIVKISISAAIGLLSALSLML